MVSADGGPARLAEPYGANADWDPAEMGLRSLSAHRHYLPPWRVEVGERAAVHEIVPRRRLARTVARTLSAAGAPAPAAMGVILSDDRELAELNRGAMGATGPTDVLAFPLLHPGAFPPHPGQAPAVREAHPHDFARPPGQRLHLGEIVISVERAITQATEGRGGQTGDLRWSPADELLLLATHGTLHLCGWDHADSEEEAAMRALEREILSGG